MKVLGRLNLGHFLLRGLNRVNNNNKISQLRQIKLE